MSYHGSQPKPVVHDLAENRSCGMTLRLESDWGRKLSILNGGGKMHQEVGFDRKPWRMPSKTEAVQRYVGNMGRDNLTALYDKYVAQQLRIRGYTWEEKPRSIYRVSKLYEALQQYSPANDHAVAFNDEVKHGISLAYAAFARRSDEPQLHVLPATEETAHLVTSNPGGSAGVTNFGCKKRDSIDVALWRLREILKGQRACEPCQAFKRTQFNDKTRLVWGFPYSQTLIEGLLAHTLNQRFQCSRTPMAYGLKSGVIGTRLRVSSYRNKYAYSIDYSQYDSSIARSLIHVAFDILRTWFNLDEVEPITGATVSRIFEVIEGYFIFTPIIMPDMYLYRGKNHGVPSGSYFTQIVDSIVNVIIAGAQSYHFKLNVGLEDLMVLGDDQLFWSNHGVELNKIAYYVQRVFQVKAHGEEKSCIYHYDEPVHFLGRDWTDGVPGRDINEVIQLMVYPETFRKYSPDPEVRDRQVKLLFLSYAAVYCNVDSLIRQLFNLTGNRLGSDLMDLEVYWGDDDLPDIPDEALSGLQRYIRKYVHSEGNSEPTVSWLLQW